MRFLSFLGAKILRGFIKQFPISDDTTCLFSKATDLYPWKLKIKNNEVRIEIFFGKKESGNLNGL